MTDPLLTPLTVGGLTLHNRVFSSSHTPGYCIDGKVTDRYVRYHEEKARGGIGLTMVGGSTNVAPDASARRSEASRGSAGRPGGEPGTADEDRSAQHLPCDEDLPEAHHAQDGGDDGHEIDSLGTVSVLNLKIISSPPPRLSFCTLTRASNKGNTRLAPSGETRSETYELRNVLLSSAAVLFSRSRLLPLNSAASTSASAGSLSNQW